MFPAAWTPPNYFPAGWFPTGSAAPPPVVIPTRTVSLPGALGPITLPGSLDTTITLPGDAEMGMYGHLTIYRGEDVELLVPITATEPITDWPLRFRLLDGYEGAVLAEYTSGNGITAVDAATARVLLPSADTDLPTHDAAGRPKRYYLTLTRTGVGRRGMILYGPVDIKPPSAV